MELIIAKNIGFCFGVKRAYTISLNTLERKNGTSCQMLGHLVHNENVINSLSSKGIEFVSSVDEVKDGIVIIRAHGESDHVLEKLKERGVEVIDATCPLVKKAQNFARLLHKDGYKVIIIGDKGHAEVEAINGAIDNKGLIIREINEIEHLSLDSAIGIVIQTTQDKKEILNLIKELEEKFKTVKVCDTFCDLVMERQNEVRAISQDADMTIVIGSRRSANTQRLVKIVQDEKRPVYGVEESSEIDKDWFSGVNRVAIISGTSTPDWDIEDVIGKIKSLA